ncbi:MAG: hypothetical protein WB699_12965 [Bacteroidota bacterium]
MRCWLVFILSITVIAVLGCDKQTNPPNASDSSGLYQYTAYDSAATIVVTGTMHFTRLDSVISGERNLAGSGQEAGSGSISGSVNSYGTITILFPSQQVGAVYLVGRQANSSITGDRYLDTGARPRGIKVGTFQLIAASH